MSRKVSVACLQTRPMPDFDTAIDEALGLAREAVDKGAQFLSLPEYCGGLKGEGGLFYPPKAPENEHPVLNAVREFAKANDVWVQIGSIAVPGPGDKTFNRGFVVDNQGAIRSRYTKIHLFDIQLSETETYLESGVISPGDEAVNVDLPWGRLGHTICYDLRFPHLYRDLSKAGAEILGAPAAFTKKTGEAHWHVLNRARAIENGAFMESTCAVGDVPGGGAAYGRSLIVGPWGEVLADGGNQPGVAMAAIDLDDVVAARRKIPALSHDRPFASASSRQSEVA